LGNSSGDSLDWQLGEFFRDSLDWDLWESLVDSFWTVWGLRLGSLRVGGLLGGSSRYSSLDSLFYSFVEWRMTPQFFYLGHLSKCNQEIRIGLNFLYSDCSFCPVIGVFNLLDLHGHCSWRLFKLKCIVHNVQPLLILNQVPVTQHVHKTLLLVGANWSLARHFGIHYGAEISLTKQWWWLKIREVNRTIKERIQRLYWLRWGEN